MREALERLQQYGEVHVLHASSVYQNRAVGMGDEADDFLNAVAEVSTELEPLELLELCLGVEQQLGRTRSTEGWASRTIDLDVLFYEGAEIESQRLTLPHPRIKERDFVAVPLAELAPELEIDGRRLSEIAEKLRSDELSIYLDKL
jgi:2-amino-4-hydroxy-6-hydroxymethyldihydropteridine diphosphokinase